MKKLSLLGILFSLFVIAPIIAVSADTWINGFVRDTNGYIDVTCRATPAPGDKWVNGFLRDSSGKLVITNCAAAPPTATPTAGPTATPLNPGNHIPNVIYGWGWGTAGASTSVPIATQALWVTAAFNSSNQTTYDQNGITTIGYTNHNLCYPTDYPRTCYYDLAPVSVCQANASTYSYSSALCVGTYSTQEATNCSGTPVYDPHYGNGYLNAPYINNTNYDNIAIAQAGSNIKEDWIFSDDTASNGGLTNGPPCNNVSSYSQSLWVTQEEAAQAATTFNKPMIVNVLNAYVSGTLLPTDLAPIANNTNTVAAECENCYLKQGAFDNVSNWQADESGCMLEVSYGKICIEYSNLDAITSSDNSQQRLYAYASFLLNFNKSFTMFQEAVSGLSDTFMVLPEQQLIPINANQIPSQISDLAMSTGYFRSWTDCFWQSHDIGACAAAVNPNASGNMTVNTAGFTHAMVIPTGSASSSVLNSPNSVTLSGASTTTLAPHTAEIMFP